MLRLSSVHKSKGGNSILKGISLDIPRGEFFVLMGPTGCGKTTALRIAGLLDRPDSGRIHFCGTEIEENEKIRLSARRRMATVFQNPVMFSGTVFSNIAWGLKIRGCSKDIIREKVGRTVEMTGLTGLEKRNAKTLSGGETKRVALARAMVLEPDILILDEPATSLHRSFREELLEKIRELHRVTGTTFLMATHDFRDALSTGTSGAVMNRGVIEQKGSVESILFNPKNTFMAEFTGTGNILPAVIKRDAACCGELDIRHTGSRTGTGWIAVPPEVIVLSRTESLTSERNRFRGTVCGIRRKGLNWMVTADVSGTLLDSAVTTGALDDLKIREGSQVFLSFKASAVHLF
jgi:molybdopterin-binding protein